MKIKINYHYNQSYLPTTRHRKICNRDVADTLNINVKELTENEFPVAFIVHDMQSVQEDMRSYDDYSSERCIYRMFEEEIRTYKGKLYRPIRITHGTAISTVFESANYIARQLERLADRNYWCMAKDFTENSVIIGDNKKDVVQILRNGAKGYLFFDGKFWGICGEPRYVINTFGLGHNHGGTGFFIEYHYNNNISSDNYFNAMQRDKAIAYGKSVALNRGDTNSVDGIGKYDNIEVIIPEMVRVKPSKQHGKGCEFMNVMENIISNSSDTNEAGILCMALAMCGN